MRRQHICERVYVLPFNCYDNKANTPRPPVVNPLRILIAPIKQLDSLVNVNPFYKLLNTYNHNGGDHTLTLVAGLMHAAAATAALAKPVCTHARARANLSINLSPCYHTHVHGHGVSGEMLRRSILFSDARACGSFFIIFTVNRRTECRCERGGGDVGE